MQRSIAAALVVTLVPSLATAGPRDYEGVTEVAAPAPLPSAEEETGATVATEDEPATDASSPAEDSVPSGPVGTEPTRADVLPDRLPPLRQAGFWLGFGGFSLLAGSGVLWALGSREIDRADRLTLRIDPETGAAPLYDDVAAEYEDHVRTGRHLSKAAIGTLAVGAAAMASAFVVWGFTVREHKRQEQERARTKPGLRATSSGWELQF